MRVILGGFAHESMYQFSRFIAGRVSYNQVQALRTERAEWRRALKKSMVNSTKETRSVAKAKKNAQWYAEDLHNFGMAGSVS